MSAVIFENKGQARLEQTDGDHATLSCAFSAPPGATLVGVIAGSDLNLCFKVKDCRRVQVDPSAYQLRGRWVNLSRAARDRLLGSTAFGSGC